MKKLIVMLVLAAGVLHAELPPETVAVTWVRGGAAAAVSGQYVFNSTLVLSNCVAYGSPVGGTNVVQDLTGLGGYLTLGGLAGASTYTNYPISVLTATSGTFWTSMYIPAWSNTVYQSDSLATLPVQLTLTNATGGSYIYRGLKTRPSSSRWGNKRLGAYCHIFGNGVRFIHPQMPMSIHLAYFAEGGVSCL